MSFRPDAGRWAGLLEDAVLWPRRVVRASLIASLVIVAVLVAYYLETGNRAVIPAIVVLAATIPVDLVVLRSVLEGALSSSAVETARVLEEAGAEAYKSRPVFNGVLAAAQVGYGQVHVLLRPSMIQAAYIESPETMPVKGRLKPAIKAPVETPRTTRRCVSDWAEGPIEVISLDPSTGIPIQARGNGKYAYKTCPSNLNPRDVRDTLSLVLPRSW